MVKLVNQFTDDWKGEVEKQKTMSKRAREILLRWGCFSEDYVERAELLCDIGNDGKRKSWMVLSLLVGVVAPMVAVVPFLFALEKDGEDPSRDGLMVSSVWMGCVLSGTFKRFFCVYVCVSIDSLNTHKCLLCSVETVLVLHAMNLAFAKIPIGGHTVCACVAVVCGCSVCFDLVTKYFRGNRSV